MNVSTWNSFEGRIWRCMEKWSESWRMSDLDKYRIAKRQLCCESEREGLVSMRQRHLKVLDLINVDVQRQLSKDMGKKSSYGSLEKTLTTNMLNVGCEVWDTRVRKNLKALIKIIMSRCNFFKSFVLLQCIHIKFWTRWKKIFVLLTLVKALLVSPKYSILIWFCI